jgi:DNA-binding NtrC family response regulator
VPSLRERRDDIPLLACVALRQFAERHGQRTKRLSAEATAFLQRQPWPGNVRQLFHLLERAAIFSDGDEIVSADFGLTDAHHAQAPEPQPIGAPEAPMAEAVSHSMRVKRAVGELEAELIREAMARNNDNKKRVAAELGISRSWLYKRLSQLGIGTDKKD